MREIRILIRSTVSLLLAFAAVAHSQDQAALPPRTVADMASLLDQYKPDPAKVEADRIEAFREPPESASKRALMEFYARRGEARSALGLITPLLEDRRRAHELARGENDEARFAGLLAVAEMQAGNLKAALELYQAVLKDRKVLGGQELSANFNIARVQSFLGDVESAKSLFSQGNALLDRIRMAPQAQPFATLWSGHRDWTRADILIAEGKYAEADAALRSAIAFYEQDLKTAEARYRRVTASVPPEIIATGIEFLEGRQVQNLIALGRLAEAELAARSLLKRTLSRVGKYAPTTGSTLQRLSSVLVQQGRFREAEAMAKTALEIFDRIGMPESGLPRLGARVQVALSLIGREQWSEALGQLRAVRAAAAGDAINARIFRGSSDGALAMIKAGAAAESLAQIRRGLDELMKNFGPDHYRTGEQRGVLAMALTATGDKAGALREFREANRVLLARAGGTGEQEGLALTRLKLRHILETYMTLLFDIRGTELEQQAGVDPAAEAFRLADALRGGSVQHSLAASAARAAVNQPGLGDLIRKEQDGHQEVAALYDNLLRLVSLPAEQQLPKVISDMRARVGQIETERAQLFAQIEKRYPDYANLINPKPATLDEAKQALRPGEALLSVLSTSEKSFVWAVNAQGQVSFHVANLTERDIAAIVAGLRKSLDPGDVTLGRIPRFDLAAAHRLYAELLGPGQGVWGESKMLYVSASGAISQIPLAILPTQPVTVQADAGVMFAELKAVPWLARKVAIADVPSVTALVRLRSLPAASAQRAPFAGFGDPQFGSRPAQVAAVTRGLRLRSLQIERVTSQTDQVRQEVAWSEYGQLSPLPDTREEILSIAQALGANQSSDVFLGADANRRKVMSADLSRRRIVAFATHGLIPGDLPYLTQPALALSAVADPKESPLLTLDDVLSLKLDADWVVLSACNTAAGDGQGAEAVSGLGRGFFYAGSRALLVTHWPVETVSARLLTTGIFERYAKDAAVTRAQALNASMLALIDSPGAKDSNGRLVFSYAHPLFWAPYALIGDGGR